MHDSNAMYMTTKEVSKALGFDVRVINRVVSKLFPNLPVNGVQTVLSQSQVTEIKKSMELSGRSDLDNVVQLKNVHTDVEMLQKGADFMRWMQLKIDELEASNAELLPKAAFFDAVADSKDAINMGDAAKVLAIHGLGQNKLFEFLRNCKVLMQNNQPFQKYIDAGYFRVIEQKYEVNGEIRINLKTLVYQRGLEYIRRAVEKLWIPKQIEG